MEKGKGATAIRSFIDCIQRTRGLPFERNHGLKKDSLCAALVKGGSSECRLR